MTGLQKQQQPCQFQVSITAMYVMLYLSVLQVYFSLPIKLYFYKHQGKLLEDIFHNHNIVKVKYSKLNHEDEVEGLILR